MRIHVRTRLACGIEAAWQELQKPTLLCEISSPFAVIRPADGAVFPVSWREGETLSVDSRLFGIVPVGRRRLHFERIDAYLHEIRTRESDPIVKSWAHFLKLDVAGDGATIYSDTVEIDAGLMTWVVAAWAAMFYRHRQRKWRRHAKTLAA